MDKYESIHGKDVSSFDFSSTRESIYEVILLRETCSLMQVRSITYSFSSASLR